MTTPPTVRADLGWALGTVTRRYMLESAAALHDVPGGPRGYQVLAAVVREDPPRQLELAHRLGLDRTVTTYLIDDLERAGLVERRPDPADRRARRILPTEAGTAKLCELERRLADVEQRLLSGLGDDESRALRELLQRVAVRIDDGVNACTAAEELHASGQL